MSAYWIAHVNVTDAETYGKYAELAGKAIAEHGGKFLVRGGDYEVMEGSCRPRNVIVEFPDMAAARRCYRSETYSEALTYASRASERDLVLLEGV
ncbi:MAG: DUF1330 domain-containing protein [Rhodobacteraceae bacterium]|nr:DUF1330 domain-containing protein [Paracoccaceae bacterium]